LVPSDTRAKIRNVSAAGIYFGCLYDIEMSGQHRI
jgi:hypothetical protein